MTCRFDSCPGQYVTLKRVTLPVDVRQCSENQFFQFGSTTEIKKKGLHMPKKLPTYSLHKATGQARVWLGGKDHYLGEYGSEESRVRYGQLISQHASGVAVDPVSQQGSNDCGPSVHELVAAFRTHANVYYRKAGKVTAEYHCIISAVRPLLDLYGSTPAKLFGPAALKAVRQRMIDGGTMCRTFINKSVGRIRRCFRYGVENELVPPAVLIGLEAVAPLLAGRTEAIDHPPRSPLPQKTLALVKDHVDQETRDLTDLALLTGARPGELVSLTGDMIDMTHADVWVAHLSNHKTVHLGKRRALVFGPQCIEILKRHLSADGRLRLFPIARVTFSNRLKRACNELGLPKFTGHWLRHTAATAIRKSNGLDGVQSMLGHSTASMSEHYAQVEITKAMEVARQVG